MKHDPLSLATAVETLGTIIPEGSGRDAIHVAVEPMVAMEKMFPGQHIGLVTGGASSKAEDHIGIVDPFLTAPVFEGQRFWMLLYPRTITGLRHVWTHPAFDAVPAAPSNNFETSEAWLKNFCETADTPGYECVMGALRGEWPGAESDEYWFKWGGWDGDSLSFGGVDAHSDIPPEFWDHVSVVLAKPIPTEKRASHFTCSC